MAWYICTYPIPVQQGFNGRRYFYTPPDESCFQKKLRSQTQGTQSDVFWRLLHACRGRRLLTSGAYICCLLSVTALGVGGRGRGRATLAQLWEVVVTVVVAVAGSRHRRRNVCWYWTTLSMFDEMSIDVLLCTTEEKEEDYVHRSSAKLKKILCTLGHSSGVLLFLKQFRLMKKPKKILCTDKLLCKNAKAAEFEF
jgi:hypothetical protein